jgi:hypothetical protein
LARLVAVAVERRLLAGDSLPIGSALGKFPDLVHPGRLSRTAEPMTRIEAEGALEVVRGCLRHLAAATPASSRPTGR